MEVQNSFIYLPETCWTRSEGGAAARGMNFAEDGVSNLDVAVGQNQLLSGETSACVTANCRRARPLWSGSDGPPQQQQQQQQGPVLARVQGTANDPR